MPDSVEHCETLLLVNDIKGKIENCNMESPASLDGRKPGQVPRLRGGWCCRYRKRMQIFAERGGPEQRGPGKGFIPGSRELLVLCPL